MGEHAREIAYTLGVDAFDVSRLPPDARVPHTDRFRAAVSRVLADDFAPFGGYTRIAVTDRTITVTWRSDGKAPEPMDTILSLLRRGEYDRATPLLRTLLRLNPDDTDALYNLGMVLSDRGDLTEAEALLRRLHQLEPGHVNGTVALSVALARQGRWADAIAIARSAVEREPSNPWAHQNLGAFLLQAGQIEEAERHLRRAVDLDPRNQQAAYGLAQAVHRLGNAKEADQLYARAAALDERSHVADLAREGRTKIAHEAAKANVGGDIRFDAVMYYLGAMEKYEKMTRAQIQQVAVEIGILGMKGLHINDPAQKYTLRSLPGQQFSGLHLMCLMNAGFRILDPSLPMHMEEEYAAARQMYEQRKGPDEGQG